MSYTFEKLICCKHNDAIQIIQDQRFETGLVKYRKKWTFQRLPCCLDRGPIWSTELSYFMTSEWLRLISQFSPTFLLFFRIIKILHTFWISHHYVTVVAAADLLVTPAGYERDWEDMKGTDVKWYWFCMDKLMHRALATTIWNISGLMNLHIFFRITQSPEQ